MPKSPSPQEENHPSVPSIGDEISALLKEIRTLSRRLSLAKNGLQSLPNKDLSPDHLEAWNDAQPLLLKETGVPSIDEKAHAIAQRLAPELKKLRTKARMKFLTTLDMNAAKDDLKIERISEAPLVLFIKPFTFEIDFDAPAARHLYGHEFIADLSLDAHEILQAHHRVLKESKQRLLDPTVFFPLLHQAYKMVLASQGLEYGKRIDVVDVLTPLAILQADTKKLRQKGLDALTPYPRYLLAMQLAHQRREGVLEHEGLRLDLGAATGGSTRNKDDVLFIPVGAKSGQYYRSLRFERATVGE